MFSISDFDIITIPFKFVNTFLINYKSNYILVDTAYPKDSVKLYNKISLITLDPELNNLKAIIITHHHSDHTGAVTYLKSINPKIRIIAHENCFINMEKGVNNINENYFTPVRTMQILTRLIRKFSKDSGRFEKYQKKDNDILVKNKPLFLRFNNNELEFFENISEKDDQKTIKIIPTIGHTNDSICIKISNHILVGDTMASSFNIFGNHYLPVIFNDLYSLYENWKILLEEKADIFIPSHGDFFDKNEVAKNIYYFKKAYRV